MDTEHYYRVHSSCFKEVNKLACLGTLTNNIRHFFEPRLFSPRHVEGRPSEPDLRTTITTFPDLNISETRHCHIHYSPPKTSLELAAANHPTSSPGRHGQLLLPTPCPLQPTKPPILPIDLSSPRLRPLHPITSPLWLRATSILQPSISWLRRNTGGQRPHGRARGAEDGMVGRIWDGRL